MGGHRVFTQPLPGLRREYLTTLAIRCGLGAAEIDDLDLTDFAAYIDDIDWLAAQERKG